MIILALRCFQETRSRAILTFKHGGTDSLQPLWTMAVQPGKERHILKVYVHSFFAENITYAGTYGGNVEGLFQLLLCHRPRTLWRPNRSLLQTGVHLSVYPWLLCPSLSPLKTMSET